MSEQLFNRDTQETPANLQPLEGIVEALLALDEDPINILGIVHNCIRAKRLKMPKRYVGHKLFANYEHWLKQVIRAGEALTNEMWETSEDEQ